MEVFEKLKIKKFIPALIIFGLLLFITSYHTSSLIKDNSNIKTGNQKNISTTSTLSKDILEDDNTIVFDLAKGNITFNENYVGYSQNGNKISGKHSDTNKYVIIQSTDTTRNSIVVETVNLVNTVNNIGATYNIILNGIYVDKSMINNPLGSTNYYNTLKEYKENYRESNRGTFNAGDDTVNTNITLIGDNYIKGESSANAAVQYSRFDSPNDSFNGVVGEGRLTINGSGKLIAIKNSNILNSGAAIGSIMGGESHNTNASNGTIVINGGEIYATTSPKSYAAAIGGGSCNRGGDIIINGGKIVATSYLTSATIGAGGGFTGVGGDESGVIEINGGTIIATNAGTGVSIGAGSAQRNGGGSAKNITINGGNLYLKKSSNQENVYSGNLGGGNSNTENTERGIKDGGTATVTINGGTIFFGSIGGGSSMLAHGGSTDLLITSGTLVGNTIGGGYSKTYGYASSNVKITGGSINSSVSTQPTNGSDNVYLTRTTLYGMDVAQDNKNIYSINGVNLPSNYSFNDVKTDDKGTLYLWLPSSGVINSASDGENLYEGSVATKTVGILQYNSSKKYFSTKISYNKDVKLYTDEKLTSEFSGSLMVPSNTDTSFYVQAKKYNDSNYYGINLYMSDGNTMKKISPSSVDSENGVYKYTVNITSDNYILIESIKDSKEKKLSIDLSLGNAVLESGSKTATNKLKVNGYSLDNYDGDFYLTSAGLGVTNNLIVKSGNSTITTNSLVLSSNNSGIEIENGEVNLYSSASNDSIISTDNSAIYLKKDSSLNIYDTTDGSLELTTKKKNVSAIDGEGSVVINKKDGFLILNSGEGATSIRTADYTYNAEKKISNSILPYTITLANREFVGFISSYSGTNKIYDSSYKHTTTSNSSFKAIGVEYIKYGDEVITHSIVNDNLVFNISNIGEDKVLITHVKNGNSLLENNTNYVWQQNTTTGVLTINGETVTEHLITAFVEEEELAIVVDAVNKTYNYDGSNHSIDVRVVFPTIGVKLEYCTDSDCFLEDGSKNASANWTGDKPSLSTVGVHNISWNASSPGYKDKGGVNTLTINKADNYFTSGGVMIESISKDDTLNPRAASKYGTPYFEYSSTYTGGYTTTPPTDAGIYYVRAVVDETNEYKGIVSDAVAFFIEDPTVYTLGINSWDKINTLGAQKSTIVKASINGEASMLMNFNYVPDTNNGNYISFVFSNNLPVGTVLSLVDFTNGDNYEIYYYVVEKETNTVYSNQFMKIGTTTKKSFEVGESGIVKNILYQLNIKYSEDVSSSTLRIVKNVDNKDLTLITPISIRKTSKLTENINNSIVTMSENNHVATISTTINNLNEFSNYTNVLNVSLYENDGITKKIFTPSTFVKINGTNSYINGNIATSNNIVNGSNKIEIIGLEEGTYKIKLSIYYIKNNLYNIMLPMKEKTKDLQTISFKVDKYPEYALKVSTNNLKDRGVYVKDKGKTIKFNLKYKSEEDNPKFNLVIKKNNEVINNWNYKLNDSIVNTSSLENNVSTSSLNLTIPKNTAPGTYKLYFTLGDKTIKYTIVVLEDELSDISVLDN